MPWFFYNGRVPVPVKRTDGVVVSVPPRGYVEASHHDVRKFGRKMRRCAPPKDEVEKAAKVPPTVIAPPTKGSQLSDAVTEKGVTRDPGTPPPPKAAASVEEDAKPSAARRSRSRKTSSNKKTDTASKN